ncbi:MAG: hypothetical protein QXO27_03825 [Candidatus Aenigmatarchaeota archaeon]
MGLFGPFIYKTKSGQKFWLHIKERGKVKLFYFSKDPVGALNSLPRGYEIVENPKTGLPFLKRKTSSGFFGIFKQKQNQPKKPATEEAKKSNENNAK